MTVHGGPKVVDNNLISCSDPASRNSYYTGDDNVSLLLNFDGPNGSRDFVDSSKYNHVITANGDAKISTAQSKFGGASAAFDGSGDYLTVPNNAAFQFGGGDFTIEAYIYLNAGSAIQRIYSQLQDGNNQTFFSVTASNKLSFETYFSPTSRAITSSSSVPIGEWFHAAASRSGTTWRVFINGTKEGEQTYNFTIPELTADIFISTWNGSSQPLNGYIDGLKITKGQALYTSSFTPPTAPFKSSNIVYNLTPNVESSNNNVSLLLNFDGPNGSTNFVDSSNYNHTITANGNAQISTTQSKFGGSSAAFDGSGDYLLISNNPSLILSGGVYTIEGWIYPNGNYSNYRTIVAKRVASSNTTAWQVFLNITNGYLGFYNGTIYLSSTTPTANQWSHFAAVFDGTDMNLYLNGTRVLQTAITNSDVTANIFVGWSGATTEFFNGYIDDLIITKGVAKYTNNFKVPSTPATLVPVESLRLRFDGENGSTTFRDLSPYNHTITANGNAQISTSQNKFGGSSAYFDGTGDYLEIASHPYWDFGTGDFTVELWVRFNSIAGYKFFVCSGTGVNGPPLLAVSGWYFSHFSGNISFGKYDGTTQTNFNFAWTPVVDTWYHVAVTRSGTSLRVFVDGEQIGTTQTSSTDFTRINTTTPFWIGRGGAGGTLDNYLNGYIDDLKVTKGRAIYTSNFTPPTAPAEPHLSASLLLNFDGANGSTTFTDESPYAHTITANGNAQISTTQSKFGGSSAYFDGTGDYLTLPYSNDRFDWWTTNFTFETWIYPTSLTGWSYSTGGGSIGGTIIGNATPDNFTNYWSIGLSPSGYLIFYYYNGSPVHVTSSSGQVQINTWTHIAVTQESGIIRLYVNGVNVLTASVSGTPLSDNGTVLTIGQIYNTSINGYIDSLRIVKGRALYTGNFTPPQKQQKLITNKDVRNISLYDDVSLQLNFDGANGSTTFVDSSFNNHTVTANGNAQISTTQSKFGGASAAFDGNGDYLVASGYQQYNFGAGDFTIEMWANFSESASGSGYFLLSRALAAFNVNSGWLLWRSVANTLRFIFSTDGTQFNYYYVETAFTPTVGVWYHLAVTRSGSTFRIFVDGDSKSITGVSNGSGSASSAIFDSTRSLHIGVSSDVNASTEFNGYIDDLRITKGRALYTKNFTPPTRALRNSTIYESSNKGIISCDHNNYLEIEQILNPISIDFWFKTFNTDDAAIIYAGDDSYDSTQWQWALYYYNDTLYYQPSSQSSEAIEISSVSTDTWYNIVLTRGTSGKVYINGVLVDSNSCSDTLVAGHTRIGKSGNNYWNGIFGPLKMYDYELSSSEARDNFNALKGRFGL